MNRLQRWDDFEEQKKDMTLICKIKTVTTNLLEKDTVRTLSARSSTLYQTPMRRMTTTGSKERKKINWNDLLTQDSSRYSQTI